MEPSLHAQCESDEPVEKVLFAAEEHEDRENANPLARTTTVRSFGYHATQVSTTGLHLAYTQWFHMHACPKCVGSLLILHFFTFGLM